MTTENQNNENEEVNLQDYSYAPDAKVVIPGFLMTALGGIFSKLINKEVKTEFKLKKDQSGFEEDPTISISSEGMVYQEIMAELTNVHRVNVESGVAQLKTEVAKPKLELVKP